jgi:hypothetical protein
MRVALSSSSTRTGRTQPCCWYLHMETMVKRYYISLGLVYDCGSIGVETFCVPQSFRFFYCRWCVVGLRNDSTPVRDLRTNRFAYELATHDKRRTRDTTRPSRSGAKHLKNPCRLHVILKMDIEWGTTRMELVCPPRCFPRLEDTM